MADFYQKIVDMHGTVEELVRRVPGFKGYFEKQDRRAADKLIREKLARMFGEQVGEFVRLQRKLVDAGGLEYMGRVQGIQTRLQTLIDKIDSAAQGYTGLFDVVKVDENALAHVYAFDNGLFVYQDQLATGLKEFGEAIGTEKVRGVLDQLDGLSSEIVATFGKRIDVLRGLETSV